MGINKKKSKITQALNDKLKKKQLNEIPEVDEYGFPVLTEAEEKKKAKEFDKQTKKMARRGKLQTGFIFSFRYLVKHDAPLFDRNPLIITLGFKTAKTTKNELVYGINLHYLSKKGRTKILNIITKEYLAKELQTQKSGRKIQKKFLNIMYHHLKTDPDLSDVLKYNAFRMYIMDKKHMQRVRRIPMNLYDKLFTGKVASSFKARWIHNMELRDKRGRLK